VMVESMIRPVIRAIRQRLLLGSILDLDNDI